MIKLDLHTHSIASADGGIAAIDYQQVLSSGLLDCVAITDHDRIDFALDLRAKLGNKIIVGEEISTTEGEIIGLFLTKAVAPGQSPLATAKAIKQQGGLVYIPHPFETVRKGLAMKSLDEIAEYIDVVEAFNGRAVFQNKSVGANTWAKLNNKLVVSSSDAHGAKGLGRAYTLLKDIPTSQNLLNLLQSAELKTSRAPLKTLLYPKLNRLKKAIIK